MSMIETTSATSPVEMAWSLITELALNENVAIGNATIVRFSLVDARGRAKYHTSDAAYIFDSYLGKTFLPQTDAEWIDQLMTRFRVAVQWCEEQSAWKATAAPDAIGYGASPGFAIVEALVVASKRGCLPVKLPYPD